jgi:hypothetical protein
MELASCYLSGAQNLRLLLDFWKIYAPLSRHRVVWERIKLCTLYPYYTLLTVNDSLMFGCIFSTCGYFFLRMVTFGWHRSLVSNLFLLAYLMAAYLHKLYPSYWQYICN